MLQQVHLILAGSASLCFSTIDLCQMAAQPSGPTPTRSLSLVSEKVGKSKLRSKSHVFRVDLRSPTQRLSYLGLLCKLTTGVAGNTSTPCNHFESHGQHIGPSDKLKATSLHKFSQTVATVRLYICIVEIRAR